MRKKIILYIIAFLFVTLFLYTGISKIIGYEDFNNQLRQSPLSNKLIVRLAWAIPLTELILVLMIITARWRVKAFYLSFILMILFTGYVIWINNFTYYIPCSCGGILEQLPMSIHITLNLFFSGLALAGIWLQKQLN